VAKSCSRARLIAHVATSRRSTPSPAGICTRPRRIGIDAFQAQRSPDERYRTAPLKGLWTHTKGGFYHDGRFAALRAVIDHYDRKFALGLSSAEKTDLAEYLKSL
jgi:cytochrome c peroxidase